MPRAPTAAARGPDKMGTPGRLALLCLFLSGVATLVHPQPQPPPEARAQDLATYARLDALLDWAQEAGIDAPAAAVREDSHGGFGLFANQPLKAGDLVASIPLRAVVNIEHGVASEEVGDALAPLEEFSDLEVFALFLVYETSKPAASLWQAFLDMFPGPGEMHVPMMWQAPALDALQASPAKAVILDALQSANESFAELQTYFRERFPAVFPGDTFTRERFLWAQSVLRSRTHKVPVRDSEGEWVDTMCLVPIADLMNTAFSDDLINVACGTDGTIVGVDSSFVCTATRDIPAAEELLTTYIERDHRRTNSRVLLNYGFVPAANANDTYPLDAPEVDYQEATSFHLVALHKLDLKARKVVPLFGVDPVAASRQHPAKMLLTFFRALCLVPADFNSDKDSFMHFLGELAEGRVVSQEHEIRAVDPMVAYLKAELAKYPTTLTEDTALLAELEGRAARTAAEENVLLAIRLRAAEKRILSAHVDFYSEYRQRLAPIDPAAITLDCPAFKMSSGAAQAPPKDSPPKHADEL